MARREAGFAEAGNVQLKREIGADMRQDPTTKFLMETLVDRPSIFRRGGLVYLSVRRWRNSIKPYQLDALKLLKSNPPAAFVDLVAKDILGTLDPLLGGGAFQCIVPVPCSHSGSSNCLSVLIASRLGVHLGLPAILALAATPEKGSSHPKQNVDRQAMQLVRKIDQSVIVVDDVATSGSHIEEATRLLRNNNNSILAISWIGGNAETD